MVDTQMITDRDKEDGKKLHTLFVNLSPEAQLQAQAYLSALRDKEMADQSRKEVV